MANYGTIVVSIDHFAVFAQVQPDIMGLFFNYSFQKRNQICQVPISEIVTEPISNLDSVERLHLERLRQIIYDDHFVQVEFFFGRTSFYYQVQVFHLELAHLLAVISVKSLLNVLTMWVYFLNDKVRIHLLRRCENHKLVVWREHFQEMAYSWPYLKFLVVG